MEDEILIDNYLKGLLSKNEEQSFLARLASDIEFNEKFKLEKQLFEALNEDSWSFAESKNSEVEGYEKGLEGYELQNLKKTLNRVNSEFKLKSTKSNRKLFYYLAAASVIIFLGFQFFFNQSISSEELYQKYLNLNDLPSFVSRGETYQDDLVEGQRLFESKSYDKALNLFEKAKKVSKPNASLYLYLGVTQMELNMFSEAEDTFDELINSELLDAPKGKWYKALLYINMGREEDAKALLNEITSKSLYNSDKAQKLLSDL